MASANLEQFERQFAELPTQLRLRLLERLLNQVRIQIADKDDAFAMEMAEMATDPEILREIASINSEFRHADMDGLKGV